VTFTLTDAEKKILLETARESIEARLSNRAPSFPSSTPGLDTPCGAFVTLKSSGALRGCIGHIAASRSLVETVKEVALSSAFEDPRFPPMRPEKWPGVRIEISALSPFERIQNVSSIQVGVHGILIRQGPRSGLLLPQVAPEQGWDRDTLLTHACYKAGLAGNAWKSPDTRIEIFHAIVFGEKE
jgi:AmmeMemoRadiSam system protein A